MEKIFEFLDRYITLSESERELVGRGQTLRKFKKKDVIPLESGPYELSYFVLEGELALCREDLDRETISEFFFDGEPVIVPEGFSNCSLHCLGPSTLAVSNANDTDKLLLEFPRFEYVCRKFAEERLGYTMQFNDRLKSLDPLEKYQFVLKERPDLIGRVPQHILAQYLGLAPETLSRVRRQIKNSLLD